MLNALKPTKLNEGVGQLSYIKFNIQEKMEKYCQMNLRKSSSNSMFDYFVHSINFIKLLKL